MSSKQIIVPQLGESVSEATVASWHKKPGDAIEVDELLVELETDKVTLEVNSPVNGILSEIKAPKGDTVEVGNLLGVVKEGGEANAAKPKDEVVAEEPSAKEKRTPFIVNILIIF